MLLVFGKTGQVAMELARREPDARFVSRLDVDLTKPTDVAAFLRDVDASVIINAAAYTAVDRAEEERDVAMAVNGASVGTMAEHAAARDIPFVHISTDYVFDGRGVTPFEPGDPTGPLGVYGQSKLAGEALVRNSAGRHAIMRTSWVFSAHGNNFVKTMLRLGAERDRLTIVGDQVGGPTSAASIADACLTLAHNLIENGPSGVYHFAGGPDVSWADFAREIFAQAGLSPEVVDIATADYPTPAQRPSNSRLNCGLIEREHGITRPDWRTGLAQVLQELT